MCPPIDGYQLNQVESDGESFTWTQLSGSRTILVNPPSEKNPKLFLQSTCNGNGCDTGSFLPVVFQVSIDGAPELFDYLTVYTTPTSSHFGVSAAVNINLPDAAPCRQVQNVTLVPIYTSKAYVIGVSDELVITWDFPSCSSEYLTGTSISKNDTGQYVVLDTFGLDEERIFAIQPNVSYRVGSQFSTRGRQSASLGDPFRFTFDDRKVVLADETIRGLSVIGQTRFLSNRNKTILLELKDLQRGVSVVSGKNFTRVKLGAVNVEKTENHNGVSVTGRNSFTRIAYGGGVIIG